MCYLGDDKCQSDDTIADILLQIIDDIEKIGLS